MNLPATWALRTCPCGLISKLTYSKASKKSSLRRYLIPSRLQPTCPVTWAVIAACSSLETDLIPYWRKTTNYTQAATGGKAVKAAALAGIFIKCCLLHETPMSRLFMNHPFIQSFVAHWSCFLIVAFKNGNSKIWHKSEKIFNHIKFADVLNGWSLTQWLNKA